MVGFFPGSRGLRQGDPLSPLLFTLIMETLSASLRAATENKVFSMHWKCSKLNLTHLSFADDILIFCRADTNSVKIILETLKNFAELSGLQFNPAKSTVFVSNTRSDVKERIVQQTGFLEGTLPVTYLGVPLVSARLRMRDCSKLVDIIAHRLTHWTSRLLSYAGRLQLINSTLFSVQTYWSSMFILPIGLYRKIEKMTANFLWTGSANKVHRLKVPWEKVTLPRNEGGLGIKKLGEWNKAASLRHLWLLISSSTGSL